MTIMSKQENNCLHLNKDFNNLSCECHKLKTPPTLMHHAGACPGFLKGGSNISWFPKKKGHQILKWEVQRSDPGGPVHKSP